MRLSRLFATAAVAAALLAPAMPAAATSAPPPRQPAMPGPWQGTCNTYGAKWCVNPTYRKRFDAAIAWSDAHTSREEREPVPYPVELTYLVSQHPRIVYVVLFKLDGDRDTSRVWKYGITRVVPWQHRANVGVRACQQLINHHDCRPDWVAATSEHRGFGRARYIEAALVKRYELQHGVCPPGQVKSCR